VFLSVLVNSMRGYVKNAVIVRGTSQVLADTNYTQYNLYTILSLFLFFFTSCNLCSVRYHVLNSSSIIFFLFLPLLSTVCLVKKSYFFIDFSWSKIFLIGIKLKLNIRIIGFDYVPYMFRFKFLHSRGFGFNLNLYFGLIK